jgi:hypothetical protein
MSAHGIQHHRDGGNHIGFSTMTLAETIYLIEKYRLPGDMYRRLI